MPPPALHAQSFQRGCGTFRKIGVASILCGSGGIANCWMLRSVGLSQKMAELLQRFGEEPKGHAQSVEGRVVTRVPSCYHRRCWALVLCSRCSGKVVRSWSVRAAHTHTGPRTNQGEKRSAYLQRDKKTGVSDNRHENISLLNNIVSIARFDSYTPDTLLS